MFKTSRNKNLYKQSQYFQNKISDPFFNNIVVFLRGDGANNSTSIVDSSPSPKTITRVGDTKISTIQSKYGGSSIYFDGNGDYLSLPVSADFSFNANFTIEFWYFHNATGQEYGRIFKQKIGDTVGGLEFALGQPGTGIYLWYSTNNSTFNVVNARLISSTSTNTWYHVALSVDGSTAKAFVNGVIAYTNNSWTSYDNSSNTGCIGGQSGTSRSINGYIDSIRITKGIARYSANFNPETDTYLQ